jgi:hypothetical protein
MTRNLHAYAAATIILASCGKSELRETVPTAPSEIGQEKTNCPQQTVNASALSTYGMPGSYGCTGQLRNVWKSCYTQFNLRCTAPSTYYTVTNTVYCGLYTNLATNSNGITFTYQDQRDIINGVRAAALAARPNCPSGGLMQLVDLYFCEDPNFPDTGFCGSAKYACCVN